MKMTRKEYDDLLNRMKELKKQIECAEVEEPKHGIHEKVESEAMYYYVNGCGNAVSVCHDCLLSDDRFNTGNYYHPDYKDLCKLDAARYKLYLEMLAWSDAHGGRDLDWSNYNVEKYYLFINAKSGDVLDNNSTICRTPMQVYFTKDAIDEAKKLFGDRLINLYYKK